MRSTAREESRKYRGTSWNSAVDSPPRALRALPLLESRRGDEAVVLQWQAQRTLGDQDAVELGG